MSILDLFVCQFSYVALCWRIYSSHAGRTAKPSLKITFSDQVARGLCRLTLAMAQDLYFAGQDTILQSPS